MPVIATNSSANAAVNYLNINSNQEADALSKLSSGSRIVKASDDAAGLAISTRISSDVTALQQASTNSAQAQAILNTADGAASNISDILARMKSLASESASGTTVSASRTYIDAEFQNLITEIGNISTGTRYGGQSLLSGTTFSGVNVLVGSTASDTISLSLSSLTAGSLGVTGLSVTTTANANTALAQLDSAIDSVSKARASIGAQESMFNFSSESINTQIQNLQSANSAITDVDVAQEQATLSSAKSRRTTRCKRCSSCSANRRSAGPASMPARRFS
jgi:flagellin